MNPPFGDITPERREAMRARAVKDLKRYIACSTCPTPCKPLPKTLDPKASCPLTPSRWAEADAGIAAPAPARGVGDLLEAALKPLAVALRAKCLDENGKLRPDSGCAKRRDWLNRKL